MAEYLYEEITNSYSEVIYRKRKCEVVRCKDCKWSYEVDSREPKYDCRNPCRWGCTQWMDSNDFCSYGERKER
jgi:hypothetical protein